jgi:HD superfamily phosphohydrolase
MMIDLQTHKTVRIAVSGDVPLTRLETRIIDTAPFQRLRAIKQLSTASLVYPTAVHTRFDHSLGTLATALEMLGAIRDNHASAPEEREITPEQAVLIRTFALLHDITHIPFGHVLEDEFRIFPRHDHDAERIDFFLGEASRIGAILKENLGGELYARLMRLFTVRKETLHELGEDLFIHDLVSETLCADLLDYIRRDSFFCNIQLDTDYRFLKSLYLRREGDTRRAVIRLWKEGKAAPRRDTLNELIRLLDNRYLLGERVYFHHTKLVAGAMIAGAVARAVHEGELSRQQMFTLGDETLMDRLLHSRNPAAARLAGALGERRLWKSVYERSQRDMNAEQERLRDIDVWAAVREQWHGDAQYRMAMENRTAALLGLAEGDLLLHCPSPQMSGKFADMKVYWNGSLRSLRECTDDALVGPKV